MASTKQRMCRNSEMESSHRSVVTKYFALSAQGSDWRVGIFFSNVFSILHGKPRYRLNSSNRLGLKPDGKHCNNLYWHRVDIQPFRAYFLAPKANFHAFTLDSVLLKIFKFLSAIPINIHHSVCIGWYVLSVWWHGLNNHIVKKSPITPGKISGIDVALPAR